ncbi:MAG TPA: Flp pilus assembly protein CpaB [Herpetosiphonaceae bacterium]|nr:Flp pilus assembly protein CpaB [Herpetosiphonaceae bacterium]
MLRSRGCLLIALGLVLALGTGGLVYYLLQQAAPAGDIAAVPTPTPIPTIEIPVAARELTAGTTISQTDILQKGFPPELVPAGVVTNTGTLVGQVVLEPIQQGEAIRLEQVGAAGEVPLSLELDPGMVAMAFTREDLLNQSTVIREDDRIDLLLTMDVEEESATETRTGKSTNYTVQNIRVLRLMRAAPTQENPNPQPFALLFEMTPQDAVIAKFIKDSGGIMDFTLRSPQNTDPLEADMINNDFMFDTYGFRAPVSSTRPKE